MLRGLADQAGGEGARRRRELRVAMGGAGPPALSVPKGQTQAGWGQFRAAAQVANNPREQHYVLLKAAEPHAAGSLARSSES